MKTPSVTLSSGLTFELPIFDPFVAVHVSSAHAYVGTLLGQINGGLYAPLFAGKHDLTFLDIGANIGLVSIHAAGACRRIVAVEPAPDTFRVLEAVTHGFANIEQVRAALAPVDGSVEFYVNDLNSTASSTVNTYGTKITVPGLKLSSILRIYQLDRVDVCKIDAEGSEGEALSLEELTKASDVIASYWIEFHNCPKSDWQHKLGTTVGNLLRLGYYRMTVDGMTLMASK